MRDTITISLPESLREQLDRMVADGQGNRSDVVREAIRQFLHREEFRRLRRAMIPQAEAAGVYTDDDVFRIVS